MLQIQEHRMGRVGMSPPHPWLNLPGSFGTQQAEQGVGMAMDCLPGELVTMRREGGRKSLQSWERIHRFTAFLLHPTAAAPLSKATSHRGPPATLSEQHPSTTPPAGCNGKPEAGFPSLLP